MNFYWKLTFIVLTTGQIYAENLILQQPAPPFLPRESTLTPHVKPHHPSSSNHHHHHGHHSSSHLKPVGEIAVVQVALLKKSLQKDDTTAPTFGKGILPTARQNGADWPFTSTTSRARVLSAKAPPIDAEWLKSPNRTIKFTAVFEDFEQKFYHKLNSPNLVASNGSVELKPKIELGDVEVDISALEKLRVNFTFQYGKYFTTVLRPTLVARKQLVIEDRTFDFNISLQLHQWNKTDKMPLGAQIVQTVTQGRYTANPVITLRWPIEYAQLVKFDSPFNLVNSKKSTSSKLAVDVNIVISHPNGSEQPLSSQTALKQLRQHKQIIANSINHH